jgi:hypothetical protein
MIIWKHILIDGFNPMKNLLVGWGQYPVLVVKIKQIMITIRIIIEYIYIIDILNSQSEPSPSR